MWNMRNASLVLSAVIVTTAATVSTASAELVIDGSGVGCSSAGIWYADHVRCELERNVRGIDIAADGVTVDCRDHVVQGAGEPAGIKVVGRSKVTIRGCRVIGFQEGIVFQDTSEGTIENNILTENPIAAITVRRSQRTTLKENRGLANGLMVRLDASHDSVIENNTSAAQDGFVLTNSDRNVFRGNTVDNAPRAGFVARDSSENHFVASRAVTSMAERESVAFGFEGGIDNVVEDSVAGGFAVCFGARSSHGVRIERNEGHECQFGTAIEGVDHAQIRDNLYLGGSTGVAATDFFATEVTDNTVRQSGVGFSFVDGMDSVVKGNDTDANEIGLYAAYIEYTVFDGNRIRDTRIGASVETGTNLTVTNNTVERAEWHGIGITSTRASVVRGNETVDGGVGVLVTLSEQNEFVRNRSTRNDTGFYASGDTADNEFTRNVTTDSSGHGFVDTSLGTMTAGTRNRYKGNRCVNDGIAGASPDGLCRER